MAKKLKIRSKDKLVHDVIRKFDERSAVGYAKYGTTLRDDPDDLRRWINDVQEELMDAILYMQKCKETLQEEIEECYINDRFEDVNLEPYDGEECEGTLGSHPLCCTDFCPCKENTIMRKASGDIWVTTSTGPLTQYP